MSNDIPRRARIDLWTTGEAAIQRAVDAVEQMGAHPILTDVVVALCAAKDKLGQQLDSVECGEPWCKGVPGRPCTHPDGSERPHHDVRLSRAFLAEPTPGESQ